MGMKFCLIGYMGSGKSTLGKLLAIQRGIAFIDLDSYIEEKEGKSIATIFSEKGVIYFRKIEKLYLDEILASSITCVLALGGGTPCYSGNMKVLNTDLNVKTIYLKANPKSLSERLYSERHLRPLIKNIDNFDKLVEFIGIHLFERSVYYNQADFCIDISEKTIQKSLNELNEVLTTLR